MKSTPEQLLQELKLLKTEKGIISGKFKLLQKGSPAHTQQLILMKQVSDKINLLEAEIKNAQYDKKTTNSIQGVIDKAPFIQIDSLQHWPEEIYIDVTELNLVAEWPEFLRQNSTSLPSHNPAWADVIKQSFKHNSFILCARSSSGQLLGGIPFTIFSSPLFGKFAVSMPYLNYGGVVSEYKNVCIELMQALNNVRKQFDLKHIEVRSIYDGIGDNPSTKKVSMLLQLPGSDKELDKILGSKLRAQYKKAEEFNPEFRIGKCELLNDFYAVFSRNMRDLGTPVYAKHWFSNILKHPNLDASIIIIYIKGKPVSCGFLVKNGSLMEIPWASTIKKANKYNTNMWMYRNILSFAIEQGCEYFDFGRSTMDAGTYKFKKQWGAKPYQHYWYCLLPPDSPRPELNPDNPKLKIFIRLWKWLPVWIANIIGPGIIKGIP
jgi:serine/alanine adding enzyme